MTKEIRELRTQKTELVTMAKAALAEGKTPEVNDTKSYENGVKAVPAFLLPPQIVTKENAAESYANDAKLLAIVKAAS